MRRNENGKSNCKAFYIYDSGKLGHDEHFFLLTQMSKIALKRDIPL